MLSDCNSFSYTNVYICSIMKWNNIPLGLGFNATFNNISAISWRSALLMEETGVLGENHRPATSY